MLNFLLSSSLRDAHSRRIGARSHLQNTFSVSARNKKMHVRRVFFSLPTMLSYQRRVPHGGSRLRVRLIRQFERASLRPLVLRDPLPEEIKEAVTHGKVGGENKSGK